MSINRIILMTVAAVALNAAPSSQLLMAQTGDRNAKPSSAYLKQAVSNAELEVQSNIQIKRMSEVRLREMEAWIESLQNKRLDLLQQQNQLGVSSASYSDIMRLLQTQKVQLSIDLAGIEERRAAMLEQQKANQTLVSESNARVIASLKELEAIQDQRLQQAEQLRQKGSAPQAEVLDAKQQLLEVRIRLAEILPSSAAGGGQPLDHELLSVSLSRAETVGRLNKVNQLLQEYVPARTPIDAFSRIESELNAAEIALLDLRKETWRIDDQLDLAQMNRDQLLEQLKRAQEDEYRQDQ